MLFLGTSIPLGDAGTWDSSENSYPGYIAFTNYQMTIQGTLFSDQDGTLFIDQAGDYTVTGQYTATSDWDYTITIPYTGATGINIFETVVSPCLRVRYTNSSTPQATFRLFLTLNNTGSGEPG